MLQFDFNCLYEVGNCIVTFVSSSYDIGTDAYSGYRYLHGHNVQINQTSTNITTQSDNERVHTKWGILMIIILFIPGLYLACKPSRHNRNELTIRFLSLFFPIYMIGYTFYALRFPRNVDIQRRLALACACEAFFESFPQIVFTCYTYAFVTTHIHLISKLQTLGSIILLGKGIIAFDVVSCDVKLDTIKDIVLYPMRLLPLYLVGTFFRISALTLTCIYLRQWAIIPTFFLFVMMVVTVGVCIQWKKDTIYALALTNMSVANVGMIRMKHLLRDDVEDEEEWKEFPKDIRVRCQRFIQVSSYVTFLHHAVVLIVVLYLACTGSSILPDTNELEPFFRPTEYWPGTKARWVYITFSITIMIGCLDVIVTSFKSKNIKFGRGAGLKDTQYIMRAPSSYRQ